MDVVIIGGGAAGMMTAIFAARQGAKVTLVERNNFFGVKLNITGKGRCNLTNNCDVDTLIKNTVTNSRFMYASYMGFTPQDVMDFFEELGIPLKTERGNRVFPVSDRAKDISEAMVGEINRLGVKIKIGRANAIITQNNRVTSVKMDSEVILTDAVVLATGGMSYPKTGSSGDGFNLAKKLGHSVSELSPSLTSLKLSGTEPKQLEGLALRNIGVYITKNGKNVYTDQGELLFTADGVSGPVILSGSAHMLGSGDYKLGIDLKPALSEEVLDKRILRDFEDNLNRDFLNSLGALMPRALVPIVVDRSKISPTKKVNEITKDERGRLLKVIKNLDFDITGTGGFSEAVVTRGGVSVKEINPKNMSSKIVEGLYFAGEIIDVDAYTGGFNLQIAWSTAHSCGMALK